MSATPAEVNNHPDWRRRAYGVALATSFATYLALNAVALGMLATAIAAVVLAAVVLSLFNLPPWPGFARLAALAAGVFAAVLPLGQELMQGRTLPEAVHAGMAWPQILVLLFAGRVLAADADFRFIAFWRDPARNRHARTQSLGAAVLTGVCLVLVFYTLLEPATGATPAALDPWSILRHALGGTTFVHVAIVMLFVVTLAAIADAALVLAADLQGLAALRRSVGQPEVALAAWSHTRPLQEVGGQRDALANLHLASRRLIRALISFLPLLGFLGTVIGLTAAIGGLPENLGPSANGNLDIGASLVGLSVKFETTLLGLVGALIASLLLALIERREGEMLAETRHLIETSRHG